MVLTGMLEKRGDMEERDRVRFYFSFLKLFLIYKPDGTTIKFGASSRVYIYRGDTQKGKESEEKGTKRKEVSDDSSAPKKQKNNEVSYLPTLLPSLLALLSSLILLPPC